MTELVFVFWHWWVIALVLLVVEILTPGFFFLWMAVSGFVTGCFLWLVPSISLNTQLFVFSLMSIVTISVWKFYVKKHPIETDHPLLNQRGAQHIGRIFSLVEPIVNGQGKIKADDSMWKVHGEDCELGAKVKVVAVRGTEFEVEKVQ